MKLCFTFLTDRILIIHSIQKSPEDSAIPVGIFDILDIEHPKFIIIPEVESKKKKEKEKLKKGAEVYYGFQFPLAVDSEGK
jgi:hypothetical protein